MRINSHEYLLFLVTKQKVLNLEKFRFFYKCLIIIATGIHLKKKKKNNFSEENILESFWVIESTRHNVYHNIYDTI